MIELSHWERLFLFRILPTAVVVLFAAATFLAIVVESVGDSTDRVEQFVNDLEEETPEEAAQAAAVTEAVRQVPELRVILCQAFPTVPACESG